jgi:hypothetical protein
MDTQAARRDAEVEILDETGAVVARSGTRIRLGGGDTVPARGLRVPAPA